MLHTNEANTAQIRIQVQQQIVTITTINSSSDVNDGFL